jgi:hypothetical protein
MTTKEDQIIEDISKTLVFLRDCHVWSDLAFVFEIFEVYRLELC